MGKNAYGKYNFDWVIKMTTPTFSKAMSWYCVCVCLCMCVCITFIQFEENV
jgi:hypothetical protein